MESTVPLGQTLGASEVLYLARGSRDGDSQRRNAKRTGVILSTGVAASYSASPCYGTGLRLMSHARQWTIKDAEHRMREILDRAKSGTPQRIVDEDGRFEVQYVLDKAKQTTGQLLAKGGPVDN